MDALILNGASLFVGFTLAFVAALTTDTFNPSDLKGLLTVAGVLGGWLYYALMESSQHQATIGKRRLGICVTDANGRRISFARASGRFWSRLLSAIPLGIGFLLPRFTKRKQALHDLVAGCVVIRKCDVPKALVIDGPREHSGPSSSGKSPGVLVFGAALVLIAIGAMAWPAVKPQRTARVPFPHTRNVASKTTFACESLVSADVIGSPEEYLTNGIEGSVQKGTDKFAMSIKDERTLSFLTAASVEVGTSNGEEFRIITRTTTRP
jgi:uncharacterized RDD family membrane protein YckC